MEDSTKVALSFKILITVDCNYCGGGRAFGPETGFSPKKIKNRFCLQAVGMEEYRESPHLLSEVKSNGGNSRGISHESGLFSYDEATSMLDPKVVKKC